MTKFKKLIADKELDEAIAWFRARKADIVRDKKRIATLEAQVALRDETMTIAYRLWLQGYHTEVGDYLLPFSTDLGARAGKKAAP